MGNDLWQLCGRYGIATDYHDIWGARHAVAPEHLRALLREFGADPDGADETPARPWHPALPAVVVSGTGSFDVQIWLPQETDRFSWRIDARTAAPTGARHIGRSCRKPNAPRSRARRGCATASTSRRRCRPATTTCMSTASTAQPCCCARRPLLRARRAGERRPALGPDAAAAQPAVAPQLGHRRLHRPGALRRARGAGGRGLHRPQSAARAVPAQPGAHQPLQPVLARAPQRAVPRRRGDSRLPRLPGRPAARALAGVPGTARGAARRRRWSSTPASRRPSSRSSNCSTGTSATAALADDVLEPFRRERGRALRQHALFEALQEHFFRADAQVWGWPVWPAEFRDPEGPAVARFAQENADRVGFFEYLQWQCALQLDAVARQCRALGMPIGLYQDLAVSVDRAGSDAWRHQPSFALGASVGAPPDEFNPNGQNWGLPPLRPDRLPGHRLPGLHRSTACLHARRGRDPHRPRDGPDAAVLDSGGRHGARRRLRLLPDRGNAGDRRARKRAQPLPRDRRRPRHRRRRDARGAAPLRRAVVPPAVLRAPGGGFRPPADYPRDALVAVSTHDLATLAGWWAVHDLRIRHALHLFPDDAVFEKQLLDRAQERVHLLSAVQRATDLPGDVLADAVGANSLPLQAVEAVHAFLALTPSKLMVVQLEDALGEVEQANMPGTTDQHPNWRRKYARELETLWETGGLLALCRALTRIRPRATQADSAARRDRTLIPRATYRLQFHAGFTFDDAIRTLPYLARLGISHVYCSPIQRARPGSMHGYDVVAHDEINPELGGMPAFERFTQALRAQGMGQLLDLVPNHMGVLGADNPWWMDVLENGACSLYADYFDIEWQPLNAELVGKVLLPVLGDHYGDVLDRGELQLRWDGAMGELAVHYHAHRFPLAPQTYRPCCCAPGSAWATPSGGQPGQHRHRVPAAPAVRRCFGAGRRRTRPRQGAAQGAAGAPCHQAAGSGAGHRPGDRRTEPARRARRAARPAGGAVLAARLLARGGRRDQLPPLLRHQRTGGPAHRTRGGFRGDACAGARPGGARMGRRVPHRSPRRALRSGAVLRAAAAGLRAAHGLAPSAPAAGGRRPGRSTWSPRRSPRRRRKCPRHGPCTAPPATASPTSPTACWSSTARPSACAASGAPSPSTPRPSRTWSTTASAPSRAARWHRS